MNGELIEVAKIVARLWGLERGIVRTLYGGIYSGGISAFGRRGNVNVIPVKTSVD